MTPETLPTPTPEQIAQAAHNDFILIVGLSTMFGLAVLTVISMFVYNWRAEHKAVIKSGFRKGQTAYYAPSETLCVVDVTIRDFFMLVDGRLVAKVFVEGDSARQYNITVDRLHVHEQDAAKEALDNISVKQKEIDRLRTLVREQLPQMHDLAYKPKNPVDTNESQ